MLFLCFFFCFFFNIWLYSGQVGEGFANEWEGSQFKPHEVNGLVEGPKLLTMRLVAFRSNYKHAVISIRLVRLSRQ